MYETLIQALFSNKNFTVYGFDYTKSKAHTTITTYCWVNCKLDINMIMKGVYAKSIPKDYKVLSTSVTNLNKELKFYDVQPHSNQINTKIDKKWDIFRDQALNLLYGVGEAPFIKPSHPHQSVFCSCGESCYINKTTPNIIVYTCCKCKLRFFWHSNVLTLCYHFRDHKNKKPTKVEECAIKFTDPKGVELKMQLGSCGHAWTPLREGKKCPTCFLTNKVLTSLSTLHSSVDILKKEMATLKMSG